MRFFNNISGFHLTAILLSLFTCFAITGCGITADDLAGASSASGRTINGIVHGGAYPIQGATIRLMETKTTSSSTYGSAAKQLLSTTSDAQGNFGFPDTGWTCDAGEYAYITVTGGTSAATTAPNKNVVQVGVIGACSTDLANQQEVDNVNVYVTELSTVATAYALGSFISIDNTNASSGEQIVNIGAPARNNSGKPGCTGTGSNMTCTAAGLANAFANAYNLVDAVTYDGSMPSGIARTTLPNNAQAIVPQALLHTLANILQSCVDSNGGKAVKGYNAYASDGTHCGDLFTYATPPNGTAPTNTLQTALNMANYPTNNVDSLFKLQPQEVFFRPYVTTDKITGSSVTLMSFAVSIFYTGTGLSGDAGMPYPVDVALDAQDNVYVLYTKSSSGSYAAIDGFSPNGAGLFAGPQSTAIANPTALAIDNLGQAWVSNDTSSGKVYGLSTSSGSVTRTLTVSNGYPGGIAVDSSNNLWVARDNADYNQSVFRFAQSSSYASTSFASTPRLYAGTKRLVVDAKQNPYGVSNSGLSLAKVWHFPYASDGSSATLSSATLGASSGFSLAMTNADQAFIPLAQELDSASGLITGLLYVNSSSAGVFSGLSSTNATYNSPMGVAIDGGGNIAWSDNESNGQIFVMTPNSSGSISSGTLTSFLPCYAPGNHCTNTSGSYLSGMAIDSAGSMWAISNSGTYAVVQTIGFAAPTWPLAAYAHGGVAVQ